MASRRDQLHSYQFMVQRLASAVIYRETDPERVPFRRSGGTLFIGVMLAVLALGAAGIYGVLAPGGNTSWRTDKAIIVEKETGARYVYLDGTLHPVLNYASARLILKQNEVPTLLVSAASLRGVPRGAVLGIAGAPDSLPPRTQLVTGAWVLCSRPDADDAGRATARSVLFIGGRHEGGRVLDDSVGLLVQHPDGSVYLVWHSTRYAVREPQLVLTALALGQAPVVPAAPAWINALPAGPDLKRISIAKRGAAGPLPNSRVGQVVLAQSQTGEAQYYAVLDDGVADITQVQADILLNDPDTAVAYPGAQPQAVRRTDLATAKKSAQTLLPRPGSLQPPARTPAIVAAAGAQTGICATFTNVATPPQVSVGVPLPQIERGAAAGQAGPGAVVADQVVVSPGGGVVVEAAQAPEATGGAVSIVTDLGVRHPLASPAVLGYLGYDGATVVRMPAGLVALVPAGRALDPAAAGLPVTGS